VMINHFLWQFKHLRKHSKIMFRAGITKIQLTTT
jgi:hypothetical protein